MKKELTISDVASVLRQKRRTGRSFSKRIVKDSNTYFGKTTEERFWEKVSKSDRCWNWTGCHSKGRGFISFKGKMISVPRYAYALYHGEVAEGLCVCHTCDNPACVKKEHLWLGSHAENMRDMRVKGRLKGEKAGKAKLTEQQVREIRRLYSEGTHSYRSLGRIFGVNKTPIGYIIKRINWSHVE